MKAHLKLVNFILPFILVAGPLALDVHHADFISGGWSTSQSVDQHNCVGRELHNPLSEIGTCLPCSQHSQFQAQATQIFTSLNLAVTSIFRSTPPDLASFSLCQGSSERGPPGFIS